MTDGEKETYENLKETCEMWQAESWARGKEIEKTIRLLNEYKDLLPEPFLREMNDALLAYYNRNDKSENKNGLGFYKGEKEYDNG